MHMRIEDAAAAARRRAEHVRREVARPNAGDAEMVAHSPHDLLADRHSGWSAPIGSWKTKPMAAPPSARRWPTGNAGQVLAVE